MLIDWRQTRANLLQWQWAEDIFNWILKSGGKIASILFLTAGIWLSINNSEPDFIVLIMPLWLSKILTYLSKVTFTGLPEIILFLSALQTLDQIKMIRETEKESLTHNLSIMWACLFGLPTIGFISYTLYNVAASLVGSNYQMPNFILILRGLTCVVYGLVIFLYNERGRKCFADEIEELKVRLKNSEKEIADNQNAFSLLLNASKEESKKRIQTLESELILANSAVYKLSERASSLVLEGLSHYPNFVNEVVNKKVKTLSLESITQFTGLSKRRILNAKLKKSTRNNELYLTSSVVDWLQSLPPTTTSISQIEDYMEA